MPLHPASLHSPTRISPRPRGQKNAGTLAPECGKEKLHEDVQNSCWHLCSSKLHSNLVVLTIEECKQEGAVTAELERAMA
jgi:hypothetical protein